LTTEYPANGSSFRTRSPELARAKAERSVRRDRVDVVFESRELETLVVKLLRAYGECLGARSR
jgi:hypothetical protein